MRSAVLMPFLLVGWSALGQLPGLVITGDASTFPGASWTYQQTVDGTVYDLSGILRKPAGEGPFPAVIVNHGTGGNANGYSRAVANEMVTWGYVGIAANLTHSGGVPCGSPGDCVTEEYGSSPGNILRAMKCHEILGVLGYVDTTCIAAFGHSRGAWLTTGLVAAHPLRFTIAGHTAGGVNDAEASTAPSAMEAAAILCPYILQHGDADTTVPIAWDLRLDSVLTANGVEHEFITFPGYTHAQIAQDAAMYANAESWFSTYGCTLTTPVPSDAMDHGVPVLSSDWFDAMGKRVSRERVNAWPTGLFIARDHLSDGRVVTRRILLIDPAAP